MTQTTEFKQSGHLNPALTDPATRVLNAEQLTGRWVNTNRRTRGIAECVVERDGEGLSVSVSGVGEAGPTPWPKGRALVLANLEEEAGQRTVALAVDFDFGFMRAETQIRVNKGVLVIVLFNTFHDGSGRADYVTREFFYRAD
ncbi:MAG TPA: hypothetical protein VF591_25415 [Pyrinomonadaceae bacterium]|jgi:hypothetical protein